MIVVLWSLRTIAPRRISCSTVFFCHTERPLYQEPGEWCYDGVCQAPGAGHYVFQFSAGLPPSFFLRVFFIIAQALEISMVAEVSGTVQVSLTPKTLQVCTVGNSGSRVC